MADLKLIQLAEIRDERDDRVVALEGAVGELQSWRQEVDGHIDDICYLLCRLPMSIVMPPRQPLLMACQAAAEQHPGGTTVDWPIRHRVAMTTQVPAYGSVMTIVPSPANGMSFPPNPGTPVPHSQLHPP